MMMKICCLAEGHLIESVLLSLRKKYNKEVCNFNYEKNGFSSDMWGRGWDKFETLISKHEDKWWDIDIKNITVSHCVYTKCISGYNPA